MQNFSSIYIVDGEDENCNERINDILQANPNHLILKDEGNYYYEAVFVENGKNVHVNLGMVGKDFSKLEELKESKKASDDSHFIKQIELIIKKSIENKIASINKRMMMQGYDFLMKWDDILLLCSKDLELLISAYDSLYIPLKDKKLTPEFKKRNSLPENIDDMSDQIIGLMIELIQKDNTLLHNLPDRFANLILKKLKTNESEFYNNLITQQFLPKLINDSKSKYALKFHTYDYHKMEMHKKDLESNYPKECFVGYNYGVFIDANPSSEMKVVRSNMFQVGIDEQDGIGYTLFLPQNYSTPKAIMIWVYGGKRINECNFLNLQLSHLDLQLLKDGIAVAYLNTPERSYYKGLQSTQLEITQEGQKATNETISAFVSQLRDNPQYFHDKCQVLKDIPIYLTGFSFGGSVVLRYSQLYENNLIDGFISINGAVSLSKIKKHERQIMSDRWTNEANQAMSWLSPEASIHKKESEKPTLIVQNIKDTNANVYNAISFFNKSKKQEINGITIFLFDDDTNASYNQFDHEIPKSSNHSFTALANAISCFILKKNSEQVQSLNIEETKIKMALYNSRKSLTSRFVSYAYRYYPEDFNIENLNHLDLKKYDSLLAGLYYANKISNPEENSLKVNLKNLDDVDFQDPKNSLLRKYLASYLYFSIWTSNQFSFLHEDEMELQKTINMAIDNSEVQQAFLEIYRNTEFIEKGNFLHMIENLYICCPNLIPKDIYEQNDFLEFKEKAYKKLEESVNKLEPVDETKSTSSNTTLSNF